MKNRTPARLMLAAAVASGLYASKGSAQVLYEPFSYANNAVLDSGSNFSTSGTSWSQRGSQSADTTVITGSLGTATVGTVPPLPAAIGNSARFPTTNSNLGRVAALNFGQTFTTPGDYYYSFTMKAPTTLTAGSNGVVAGFSNFSIPTPNAPGTFQAGLRVTSVAGGAGTGSFTLGFQGGGQSQNLATVYQPGDTLFIVARYTINAGTNNDQIALWVNPTSGFGDNGSIPAANVSLTHTSADSVDAVLNNPMLASLFLRTVNSGVGFQFDEVRVDKTWAGVTPNGNLQYNWNTNTSGNIADATWNKLAGAPTASPNGNGHVANFGTTIASGSSFTSAGETLDTITFTNSGSLTVNGSGLTMQSPTSAAQIVAYSGTHTISAPLTMNSDLSIKTQGAGTSVTLGNTVTGTKTLGVYGTGSVKLGASNLIDDTARLEVRSGTLNLNGNSETVGTLQLGTSHPNNGSAISLGVTYNGDLSSGTISNGTISAGTIDLRSGTIGAVIAGTSGVVKNESGVVTLSGANTYTGSTTVNKGVLKLTGTNSNPITAVLNPVEADRGSTGTLLITADSNLGATGASVTMSTTGGQSGQLQFGDNMTLAADRSIVANATNSRLAAASGKVATINAPISGTGGIFVNYPWDPTVVSTGVDNNTVKFGAQSLIGGTVVLNSTSNTYAGNTTVAGGRLLIPSTASLPAGTFGVAGKIVTITPPDYPTTSATVATPTTPSSIGGVVSVSYGGPSDWSDADIQTLRDTVTWGSTVSGFNALAPSGTFIGLDTTNATSPVTFTQSLTTGNYGFSKHGAGTLTATSDIGLSGNILVDGGTLNLPGNLTNAGANAGVIYVNGGTLNSTGTVTNGGAINVFGGALSTTGSVTNGGGINVTGGTLSMTGPVNSAGAVSVTGGTATISGNLNNGGTVTAGGGTLTLSGNNGYAGATTVNGGGILVVKSNTALGTTAGATTVAGGGAADANSTLRIDGSGGDLTIAESFALAGKTSGNDLGGNATPHINNIAGNNTLAGGTISFNAGGSFYNIASNGGKLTIGNGVIAMNQTGATARILNFRGTSDGDVTGITNPGAATAFEVRKYDAGTWTFNGTNAWTGKTTIYAGRAQFTSAAALPLFATAGNTIVKGGTLGVNVGGAGEWDATQVQSLLGATTFTTFAGLTPATFAFDSTNAGATPFAYNSNIAGIQNITKLGSGTVVLGGTNTYTGGTTVNAGTLVLGNADATAGGAINVGNGAVAQAQAGLTKAVTVSTLATNASGKFDLTNNSMVVKGMTDSAVRTLLQSGYNAGAWNGASGIVSTSITPETSIGYATKLQTGITDFKGVTGMADTDVQVKFTYAGDANLDGKVDIGDLGLLAGAWQAASGKVWFDGDFTYDGAVDIGDLGLLSGNWQKGTAGNPNPPLMDFAQAMAQFSAFDGVVVPEPASLSLLALGGLAALGRRRRRVQQS